jgi:hypothetical protein
MSDPLRNVEIEDVLSSIRKLVADDARSTPAAPRKEPDRLLLTPALRVKDAPEPVKPVTSDTSETDSDALHSPTSQQVYPNDLPIDAVPGDARLADFGEVEGAFPDVDDFRMPEAPKTEKAEVPSDALQGASRLDLGRLIEEEVAAALNGASEQDDTASAGEHEPEDLDDLRITGAGYQGDEAEYLVADEADIDHPYAPFLEVPPDDGIIDLSTAAVSGDAPPMEGQIDLPPPQSLEDKVAALGRLVARNADDFEEERDTPDADDLTAVSEPMTWPDAAPANEDADAPAEHESSVPQPETASASPGDETPPADETRVAAIELPEPEPVSEAAPVADMRQPDDVEQPSNGDLVAAQPVATAEPGLQIDEDMLREMVSAIVRQELQGALGERITRNVRKLVRREIHRMLIAQEMD